MGRSRMPFTTHREFQLGRVAVQLIASAVDLPGVSGWVGTWAIYRLPFDVGDYPLRYGDTDLQANEAIAMGMANAIARAVAIAL